MDSTADLVKYFLLVFMFKKFDQIKLFQNNSGKMPLQGRTPFEPLPLPQNVNPADKVFYSDLTGEIFT